MDIARYVRNHLEWNNGTFDLSATYVIDSVSTTYCADVLIHDIRVLS